MILFSIEKLSDPPEVHLSFCSTDPGNNEIFFRRSTDNGDNFDATQNISNNMGSSHSPHLAAS